MTDDSVTVPGVTLDELAKLFTAMAADRDVIERTGIAGVYDVHLYLRSEDIMRRQGPAADGNAGTDPTSALSDALRKTGLKLVPAKRTGQFLVIDHIEKPTGN